MSRAPGAAALALDRDVRANPAYRLRSVQSLPDGHRRTLTRLGVDLSAVFGVLVADGDARLADKVVDHAGAALFSALGAPGRAPREAAGRVLELVLDGVLELEDADGFVCGPLAWEVAAEAGAPAPPEGRLARLSHAAVRHAERLRLARVDATTARLYGYHRVPLSRRWTRAYPRAAAVRDLLRCPALSRHWVERADGDAAPVDWLAWTRRGVRDASRPLPYKLYVSPAVGALPQVLPRLVDALTDAGARRFKVGPDAAGLLRPDKVVVYMADAEELDRVARRLERALAGVPPHGVPFTAELAGHGLLSWGGDPARDAGPVGGRTESWRLSVARRLAEYLHAGQSAGLRRTRPGEYALARLALDGIDPASFAPAGLAPPGSRPPS